MGSSVRPFEFFVAAVLAAGILVIYVGGLRASEDDSNPSILARQILDATGVRGGLVVHLGCGDGRLTAELRAGPAYLVHGLDTEPENVDTARRHVQSLGHYGDIAIDRLDGPALPYADHLVNLLVAEDVGQVSREECLRGLVPGGVAYVKQDGPWRKTVKPWPDEIDEWTHHLHGPGGNAVAADSVVGPPRYLQWTDGPLWARSHGYTPSVTAMVRAAASAAECRNR